MMVGLTGVPGTGKTTVAGILRDRGVPVLFINDTIEPYILGDDPDRDTVIIDEDRWAAEFEPFDGVVEGHLAHLLPCDRVVILRCNPIVIRERLMARGYTVEKAEENALAEALDSVLIEALESFQSEVIYEYETTDTDSSNVAAFVMDVQNGNALPAHGICDWSDYLMNQMP